MILAFYSDRINLKGILIILIIMLYISIFKVANPYIN